MDIMQNAPILTFQTPCCDGKEWMVLDQKTKKQVHSSGGKRGEWPRLNIFARTTDYMEVDRVTCEPSAEEQLLLC